MAILDNNTIAKANIDFMYIFVSNTGVIYPIFV